MIFNIYLNDSNQKYKTAYFASGCFWCVESIYENLKGVKEVNSGYSGGKTTNPTYRQVMSGRTGHAEAIEVIYNPSEITFKTLVNVFFGSHDPTTLNKQGPDRGTQYRSIAFYKNPIEKEIIENGRIIIYIPENGVVFYSGNLKNEGFIDNGLHEIQQSMVVAMS